MKTITLDEEAYRRLKMWKSSAAESFSKVVKRVVPVPGTLGALLNFVDQAGTSEMSGNDAMEQVVGLRSPAKQDPWTS